MFTHLCGTRCDFLLEKPNIIHKSEKLSRVLEITVNDKKFSTPTYFPAISSYGVKFLFQDLLNLLNRPNVKYPRVLVSAYDLYYMKKGEIKKALSSIEEYGNQGLLFLDSGLFEGSGKDSEKWNMRFYKSIVSRAKFDLYSSFDVYRSDFKSYEEFKKNTYYNIIESSVFLNDVAFFAILHESSPNQLVKLIEDFVEKHPNLCRSIAVAERDLGKSIQERIETVVSLRRILNDNDCRNLLHILGCGNPKSMLLYSYCGVDSFDSLDWLKFVINPDNYSINDFAHLELLDCKCRVCAELPHKNRGQEYLEKALLHNLLFYQNFVKHIQSLIRNDNLKSYLGKHAGKKIMDQIEEGIKDWKDYDWRRTAIIKPSQDEREEYLSDGYEVFIAYRRDTGRDFALHLKKGLKREHIQAFLDITDIPKEFRGKQTWLKTRDEAIKKSKKFLLIMTNGIETSSELKREIEIARENDMAFMLYRYHTLNSQIVVKLKREEMNLGELQQVDFDCKEDLLRKVLTALKDITKLD